MDQRLLHIAENLENMIIGPNEPFRFHCTQCGKCCEHREDILLNPQDLFRMAKFLKQSPADVVNHYCEVYIGPDSRIPIVRLLPEGPTKRCPFLVRNKCRIHEAKPTVCAMFPSAAPRDLTSTQGSPCLELSISLTSRLAGMNQKPTPCGSGWMVFIFQ